jgi:hypothetical protein
MKSIYKSTRVDAEIEIDSDDVIEFLEGCSKSELLDFNRYIVNPPDDKRIIDHNGNLVLLLPVKNVTGKQTLDDDLKLRMLSEIYHLYSPNQVEEMINDYKNKQKKSI